MRLKLFSTDIYVSFLFAALIALLLATDKTGFALPSLFAIIIHETGHLFAMWVLDCAPKSIRLVPASVQITRDMSNSYSHDIVIALSGPAVNLLLFGVFYFNYLCFKNELTLIYGLINLLVGTFNLLPVNGLDGGTVLFSILAKKNDYNRAMLVLKGITLILAVSVFIVAVTLTVRGKVNISLYIAVLYLFIGVIIKM